MEEHREELQWYDLVVLEFFHCFASLHSFIYEVSRNCKHPIKHIYSDQKYYQLNIIEEAYSKMLFYSLFFLCSGAYSFFSGDKEGN